MMPLLSAPELSCRELVRLITDYLEGTLSVRDRRRFDRHLRGCDGCTTYVEQMRQTIRAIGHIPHEPITSKTRDEVLAIFRAWKAERS
jgi:anti-sigma factor RsiW